MGYTSQLQALVVAKNTGKINSAFSTFRKSQKLRDQLNESTSYMRLALKKVIENVSKSSKKSLGSNFLFTSMKFTEQRSDYTIALPSPEATSSDLGTAATGNRVTNTKVVTDIDDTIFSSGGIKIFGVTLGGVDNQYNRGQMYPGAIQFAYELSASQAQAPVVSCTQQQSSLNHNSEIGSPTNQIHSFPQHTHGSPMPLVPAKVSVLTARARELKMLLKLKPSGKVCSAYRTVGQAQGNEDWGIGDVYYGSLVEWVFQSRKGLRKFKNFEIMFENDLRENTKKNLNSRYILIGDTGEKDEEAGERIATKYPEHIKAIFLHTVYECHPKVSTSPDGADAADATSDRDNLTSAMKTSAMAHAAFTSVSKRYSPVTARLKVRYARTRAKFRKLLTRMNISSGLTSSGSKQKAWNNAELRYYSQTELPKDRVIHGVPIFYFRTYVGAANKAYQHGLISREALQRVAGKALSELQTAEQALAKPHILHTLWARLPQLKTPKLSHRLSSHWARYSGSGGGNAMSKYYLKRLHQRRGRKNAILTHNRLTRLGELLCDLRENETLLHQNQNENNQEQKPQHQKQGDSHVERESEGKEVVGFKK